MKYLNAKGWKIGETFCACQRNATYNKCGVYEVLCLDLI